MLFEKDVFFVCLFVKVSAIFAQENQEVISGLCYQLDANTKQAVVMPNEDERYSGDIVIPEKVTAKDGKGYSVVGLGDECFKHSYVQTVKIPKSVKYLGNSCFEFSDIEQISIPSSVVSIGDECFNGCGYLVDVSLPNSIVSLGKRCFGSCEKIQTINLPSSITALGKSCFSFCTKLINIEIPSSVKTIGDYCFSYAKNLVEVDMPSSITNIGHNCFNECENLESIFFRGRMPDGIKDMSIPKVCMLYVPKSEEQYYKNSLRSLYLYIYPWNPAETKSSVSAWLETINGLRYLVDSKNDIVKLVAGKPYSYAGKIEVPCNIVSKDGKSRGVVAFDDFSLSGFYGLLGVTVPETVKYLGNSCFANSFSLKSITIPSSVTSIGYWCFSSCDKLESIYFEGKCPSNIVNSSIPTTCIFNVLKEYLQDYKDAIGSKYPYIYVWNNDNTGGEDKPAIQCEVPSIVYASGKLSFKSSTTGAEYHYTITDADMANDAYSQDGEVKLSAAYKISVYATAEGYQASNKATATLYWVDANLENDPSSNINQVKTRGIVVTSNGGIVTLSGLDNNEVAAFYTVDGKQLGKVKAENGIASCAVAESLVIAKVGNNTIKIAVK